MKKYSEIDFIQLSNKKHNNKYTYSKVKYLSSKSKVCITCPIHGDFLQSPKSHLRGIGCARCHFAKPQKRLCSQENFIKKANSKHNYKYDYSKTKYKTARIKVIITCPTHGDFIQKPNSHLCGCGCSHCGRTSISIKLRKRENDFITLVQRVHKNKYDYSKINYINSNSKIIIGCPIHGFFEQQAISHLKGRGCPKCGALKGATSRLKDTFTFIKDANIKHCGFYDYSKTIYTKGMNYVTITCPKHGDFQQKATCHLNGNGCQICRFSQGELAIKQCLEQKQLQYKTQITIPGCRNKRLLFFDFGLYYENRLLGVIEFQGAQHYKKINWFTNQKGFQQQKKRDKIKRSFCEKNNIPLLEIPYWRKSILKEDIEKFIITIYK